MALCCCTQLASVARVQQHSLLTSLLLLVFMQHYRWSGRQASRFWVDCRLCLSLLTLLRLLWSRFALQVGDEGQPLLVCSLREGATESVGLDLIFDQ